MIIPNIWKNKSHVPNHQPDIVSYIDYYCIILEAPGGIPRGIPNEDARKHGHPKRPQISSKDAAMSASSWESRVSVLARSPG